MVVRIGVLMSVAGAVMAMAQARNIDGDWRVTLPDVVRNEDGVQTVERTTTAHMQLLRCGDSIVGAVRRSNATISRPLHGITRGSEVVLQGETRARVNINGEDHDLALITTYRLRFAGDSLVGTTETQQAPDAKVMIPGVEQQPAPVHAARMPSATPSASPVPPPPPLRCRG